MTVCKPNNPFNIQHLQVVNHVYRSNCRLTGSFSAHVLRLFVSQKIVYELEDCRPPETTRKRLMRKREIDTILARMDKAPDATPGQPICIRPFRTDDEKLDEIVKETGEVKSSLVRRMIRFALSDKRESFSSDRCKGKLDWLIKHGRKRDDVSSQLGKQLDDIFERVEAVENEVKNVAENLSSLPTFLRELYCMTSILVSSQNLTLTRLLEFSSPNPKEREQAVLIAAAARANQIGEAVKDLNQFGAFHNIRFGDDDPDQLFLMTKVKAIKDLIAASSSQSKPHESAE